MSAFNKLSFTMIEGVFTPTDPVALNKITESGGLPLWNGAAWPGSSTGGDMYKATYDPNGDGVFDYPVLPAAGTAAGTYAAGNDSRFLTTGQKATLVKITESGGAPLWNGAAWPVVIPDSVTSLTYFNGIRQYQVATESLKMTAGIISALNNTAPGANKTPVVAVRDYRGTSVVGLAGTNGNAMSALIHTNTVQAESAWAQIAIANNYSVNPACGAVGAYLQANNLASGVAPSTDGYGGTWGSVSEVCDMTYGLELNRALYGTEIDCWVSGNNSNAIGAMIVVGDSKNIRTGVPSADVRALAGLLIKGGEAWTGWKVGATITDYTEDGAVIFNYDAHPFTGVHPANALRMQGNHTNAMLSIRYCNAPVGIDLSDATTFSSAAIKFGTGQKVDFGSGYATWPTWTNTQMPGPYDCSSIIANDLAVHSSILQMILKVIGHMMNEDKAKGLKH